jgi:hypothetical protein
VLTDLIGGVVFGGANISRRMVSMPPGRHRRLALMAKLQRAPVSGRTLSERAFPWVMDTARERWLDAVRHLEGDSNELQLAMIETRTARGLAAQSSWLIGPEAQVVAPTSHPEMICAGFSVGHLRKWNKEFSLELLAAADPVTGMIRSTHHSRPGTARTVTRKASAEGLAWLRADIEHAREVPDLVPDGLLRYLELGRWTGPGHRDRLLRRPQLPQPGAFDSRRMADMARLSQPIAHLGSWIETNRDRLGSLDPPWRVGRRPQPSQD